jgi:general secretion pathway protein F
MQFHVRMFYASTGTVAERTMDAENAHAVHQLLEREGATVLSVTHRHRRLFARRRAVFHVALFCEELRTLLSSGMSLVEAIEALCSKSNEDSKPVLLEVQQRLLEGKPLSAALELSRFTFPQLLIASIRASEHTSRIDDALDEYVAYDKVGQEIARKIVNATIYPSLVVGFGLFVCLFMLAYVVPRFAKVYDDFAHSLSAPTVVLIKVGQFAGDHLVLILLGIAAGVSSGVFFYRNGRLQTGLLRVLATFRFARYYLRLYQLARIYQTMSMLLKGGYPLADAIPLAQNLAFEKGLQNRIAKARNAVLEGKRLSMAFAANELTDNVTERLLQVGERSGNLPKIMDIIAQTHRQEFTLFIERATRLAEPILLMAMGLMIGAIIILMYMPVFDLAGGI